MEPLRNFGTRHWWRRNPICIFTSLFMVFHSIVGSTGLRFSSKVCYVNFYNIHMPNNSWKLLQFCQLFIVIWTAWKLELYFLFFPFFFVEVFAFFPEESLGFWSIRKFGLKDKWQTKGISIFDICNLLSTLGLESFFFFFCTKVDIKYLLRDMFNAFANSSKLPKDSL